jgi:hypothetical protein
MPPNNKTSIRTPLPDDGSDYHPQCGNPQCPYEKDKENWLDSKMLKAAGVVIGLLSPLFVWIVISIFALQSEVAVAKEKIGSLMEIRQDIKMIQNDVNTIKVDIATLKATKGTP